MHGLVQVGNVSAVQDVEHAVGKDGRVRQSRGSFGQVFKSADFLLKNGRWTAQTHWCQEKIS